MRVLVTGAGNAHGEAIVRRLAADGHHVRAFGLGTDDDRFEGVTNVKTFAGRVDVGGSLEPVLSERQALVHAANLDQRGKRSKRQHAIHIERGTLYTVYAAEREQVDHFLHLTPAGPSRTWSEVLGQARAHVADTRGILNTRILEAGSDPQETAAMVARELDALPELGTIIGGHDNAVTA